mgnify:CR=1 FL=1
MERQKIIIDLSKKQLNERIYSQFAADVGTMLINLYRSGIDVPFMVRGSQSEINAFMKALGGEKSHMDSYIKHGLNDGRTISSKQTLSRAVAKFENETGLRWPFKN